MMIMHSLCIATAQCNMTGFVASAFYQFHVYGEVFSLYFSVLFIVFFRTMTEAIMFQSRFNALPHRALSAAVDENVAESMSISQQLR